MSGVDGDGHGDLLALEHYGSATLRRRSAHSFSRTGSRRQRPVHAFFMRFSRCGHLGLVFEEYPG
jgi:hypothetical protein